MSRLTERIENFMKSFSLYEEIHNCYLNDKKNKIIQMALVQSFEIVFELAWKCLKDYLATKSIEAFTPKDVIKKAFTTEILPNAQIWIDMSNDRNITSHEYNEDKVLIMIEKIGSVYFDELLKFKSWLGEINE